LKKSKKSVKCVADAGMTLILWEQESLRCSHRACSAMWSDVICC
jgi:hypothetical protein